MKVKSVVSLFGVADRLLLHHVTSAVGNAGKVSCELQCGCTGIECMFTGANRVRGDLTGRTPEVEFCRVESKERLDDEMLHFKCVITEV